MKTEESGKFAAAFDIPFEGGKKIQIFHRMNVKNYVGPNVFI